MSSGHGAARTANAYPRFCWLWRCKPGSAGKFRCAGKPDKTEVVPINADFADVITDSVLVIASVRFTGLIREETHAPAESFSEIWHIQKSESQPGAAWFVAGIQQA